MFKLDKTETAKNTGFTIEKEEKKMTKSSKKKLIVGSLVGAGLAAGALIKVLAKKDSIEDCDLVDSGTDVDDEPDAEEFPDPEGE